MREATRVMAVISVSLFPPLKSELTIITHNNK